MLPSQATSNVGLGTQSVTEALETRVSYPFITTLAPLTGSWILDPDRTVIRFRTTIWRVIPVDGTFRALEGEASVAANGASSGSVVIDTTSIDTKIAKRDEHLRSPDFFKVEEYPRMTFRATDGHLTSAGHVELVGDLEIRGHTRPLTLLAGVSNSANSVQVSFEVDIDRRDWRMSKLALVRSSMKIHVTVTAYFHRA